MRLGDSFQPIGCLAHHRHIRFTFKQRLDAQANHHVVVRQQHLNLLHFRYLLIGMTSAGAGITAAGLGCNRSAGIGTRPCTCVPRPGFETMVNSPPIMRIRSRMPNRPNPWRDPDCRRGIGVKSDAVVADLQHDLCGQASQRHLDVLRFGMPARVAQ